MRKIFTILSIVSVATVANAQIVISEVYGGGGGGTATYANDYVELVNLGSSQATLTGASLQYASATGTFNSYVALPSITLNAGQKYLIEMVPSTPATAGAALPTADFQATANISLSNGNTYQGGFAMAAPNGKVALANNTSQVTGPTASNVIDFVGYGTANLYEGSGAAPALDATSSATRGTVDTNNNASDFTKTAPNPQNMATLAVSDVSKANSTLVKNTVVSETLAFAKTADIQIVNTAGQVVKSAKVTEGSTLNVSSLAKGTYIVTGTVNGERVSQKVIKN